MLQRFRTVEPWPGVNPREWIDWKWQFKNALSTAEDFTKHLSLEADEITALKLGLNEAIDGRFPVQSTPYYTSLIDPSQPNDPIRAQILPRAQERSSSGQQISDPLGEHEHSPSERIIHRYPDRVLFLVTDQCAVYCRHCLRKHFTGRDDAFVGSKQYQAALHYLRANPGIREVILSGGDPLSVSDSRLERVLADLRQIEHIDIIRIASRMPVVNPMRITSELVHLLKRQNPIFFMTHFNHPRELTRVSAEALTRLVNAGIPVMNQMVMLNGVNNHEAIVYALSRRLLSLRVKPYYVFQCDPSRGSAHFRTRIDQFREIQKQMWGRVSGLALPSFSIDIPGGGGKIGVVPEFGRELSTTANVNGGASSSRQLTGWDQIKGEYQEPNITETRSPYIAEEFQREWQALLDQPYGRQSFDIKTIESQDERI